MRCRATIAGWAYAKGKEENVVELLSRNGKSYVKINDYIKLRYSLEFSLKSSNGLNRKAILRQDKNLLRSMV